jgi:predicted AlkP superfamily pyrophosphatase or phosphodiesterase
MMRRTAILLILVWMQACGPASTLWGAGPRSTPTTSSGDPLFDLLFTPTLPPPPTTTPTETPTATLTPTVTLTPTITPTPTAMPPSAAIERVIIVSYDGLRGDAVRAAPMKHVMALMDSGAYSLTARTISYAVTLPGHASMLSGMCQAKHGVDWDVTTYYKGYSKGVDLFDLAHAAGLRTVMLVNKEKLRQLAEPETTDVFEIVYGVESTIMKAAVAQLYSGFDLMFVHIGSPDYRGHRYGWMSDAQFKALRDGDAALGLLLEALDGQGLRGSTLIIVTSDHGGHDRTHVGTHIEDLLIPWVASGPGIDGGRLELQVNIMDTAATAAYALELPIPAEWDGVPILEIFGLPMERLSITC